MPLKHDQLNFKPITPADKVKFNYIKDKIINKYGVSCKLVTITNNYKYWVSEKGDFFVIKNGEPFTIARRKVRIGDYSYIRNTVWKMAFDKKVTKSEKLNFKSKYKIKKRKRKNKNSLFLEPVLDNLVLYAVEDLEDRKVFLGYDIAKNLIGVDLVDYLFNDCKQSWIANTLAEKGKSSIRVKLLTLGSTKNEIYDLFGIHAALYEKKKWSIVNVDYLRDETDHFFIIPISKKLIKNKNYKALVGRSFRAWIKEKKKSFLSFDNFVFDIEIPESEI